MSLALARWLLAFAIALGAAAANAATLSATPASVPPGGSTVTAAWSAISTPTATDWIGLYTPGAPDSPSLNWRYTTGAASGSVPFTIPSTIPIGTYELRLFANDGYTRLATSNTFIVTGGSLTVSPATAVPGGSVTAAWSAIPAPTASDWVGLYTPAGAHTSPISWRYTTGAASGNVPFTIPAGLAFGTYQLRLFSNNGYMHLATSNSLAIGPAVSGTVTLNGSPLAGVALAPSSGGACTSSNASGQYSCAVPQGWSGSVTPSLAGHSFTPASRSYTSVTANQTAQDYATVVNPKVSGTVTLNGSPLAGVSLAATNGVTCSSSNASGQYSCTVPPGWSGSVTPSMSGYTFTPLSRNYSNVTADQTAQDYVVATVQVSGTVTAGGLPLGGASFTAANGGTCTASNASGQYVCTVLAGWSGTVTPAVSGYTLTPASRSYSNLTANQTAQDFTAAVNPASARIFYIHVDHLNTPRLITNQAQQAVWRRDSQEPFGNSPPDENPSGPGTFEFPLGESNYYADKETGNRYAMMRDCYDPATGRFCQPDPVGVAGLAVASGQLPGIEDFAARWFAMHPAPGITHTSTAMAWPNAEVPVVDDMPRWSGLSLYAYVDGNPLRLTDIFGLAPGDKWYGFNDPAFRDYVHQWKQDAGLPGKFQFSKEELTNLYKCWEEEGKPRGKGGKSGRGGQGRDWWKRGGGGGGGGGGRGNQ